MLTEFYDKYFASGLDSYVYCYLVSPQVIYPVRRSDLGMTYASGLFIGYDTMSATPPPVYSGVCGLQMVMTTDAISTVEVWIVCRSWRNAFALQSGDFQASVKLTVTNTTILSPTIVSERTVSLHPNAGWQTIKIRYAMVNGNQLYVRIEKVENINCPHMMLDSWGWAIV